MASRRGFLAELQHQHALAERNRQRASAAASKEAERRRRESERARAAAERARAAAARADVKSAAAAEREAKRMHQEAQQAETDALNANLESLLSDIDGVLAWTLGVDDHVDLEALKQTADHPAFRSEHQRPVPAPPALEPPPAPTYTEPQAPSGMAGMFKKKEHAAAVAQAQAAHAKRRADWQLVVDALPARQRQLTEAHRAAETAREAALATDKAAYQAERRSRNELVADENADLARLIASYAAGDPDAVEQYCAIVFSNSVYPDAVSLGIGIDYHRVDRELVIALDLPRPDELPTTKAFRYVKAKDEISELPQSAKEQRDRYNDLVNNIVLRTVHEMLEADRAGFIDTISLTASVEHVSPATGRAVATPVVALACQRSAFAGLDLARVVPSETLKHLNAVVSKNAHASVPIENTDGVRG